MLQPAVTGAGQEAGTCDPSGPESTVGGTWAGGEMFLTFRRLTSLTSLHAQQINTRSKSLPMREGEIDPLITKCVGNSFLLDYDALNGNKPRLKINYQPWLPYLQQEDQPIEPPTLSWSAGLPQSVVGLLRVCWVSIASQ